MAGKRFSEVETLELFFENCKSIGQGCGEHFRDCESGDWFIICAGYHWSIWERVGDDPEESKHILGGNRYLHKWAFGHAMELVKVFLDRKGKS